MSLSLNQEQSSRLQEEIQEELERREWAEPDDNVMAEYITVLLANGSARDRVQSEMDDLVGSDFDPAFLDWLFSKAASITSASSPQLPTSIPQASSAPAPAASSRLLNTALAPLSSQPSSAEKRKFEPAHETNGQNKKRLSDVGSVPSGPSGGRSLADRIGPNRQPGFPQRGGLQVRGMGGGRPHAPGNFGNQGHMGGFQHQQGFRPNMMPFGQPFMQPGQQEMMAQMMMMQANMAQMGEMMAKMAEERQQAATSLPTPQPAVRPAKATPVKVPHGTKLGSHSVSAITPKASTTGPVPEKPSSNALCRYSVGCSNARCPYSHPSPVADEKTGMVLSEEACENGKNCKDAECVKSHVSPAAALGDSAGPSRLLCKYLNCTNPSCAFRHEDEAGNSIPPPALTAAKLAKEQKDKQNLAIANAAPSSDNEDGDGDGDVEVVMTHKGLMDGALDDSKREINCRYGERCTRPDCKFSHPASRPPPKSYTYGKKPTFPTRTTPFNKPAPAAPNGITSGGFNVSKKFGAAATATEGKGLDPSAGEFKPSAVKTE